MASTSQDVPAVSRRPGAPVPSHGAITGGAADGDPVADEAICCPVAEVPAIGRKDAEWIADQFQALSDPTRVLIVNLLAVRAAELTVSQVGEAVGVTQATASHHLKILRQSGLVERRRAGNRVFLSVHHNAVCALPSLARSVVGC